MSNQLLPAEIETLQVPTREFIRNTDIHAEPRPGANETDRWALSRRPSARRKAAVEAGKPYPAEMCSELAGVH